MSGDARPVGEGRLRARRGASAWRGRSGQWATDARASLDEAAARRARIASEQEAAAGWLAAQAPCPRAQTHYAPRTPLDVARTLAPLFQGTSDPTTRIDRATGDRWLVLRNEAGAASVCVRAVRDGARVVAFGPGAERAIELVPELLGRGDDWSGLELRAVPWLAEVRRRHPGLRLCRTNHVFPALAQAIMAQKVTGLEAHRGWAWLHHRHADPAPGPAHLVPRGLRAPLTPEQWRRIPAYHWHQAGVDHARSTTIGCAAAVASALERTLTLGRGGDEITARLRTVPGVGVWTAAETTQRSHGDPDSPSFGDYHVAHGVGYALTGARTDDEGMRVLLEPWRGHRQRVVRLLGLSGRVEPRRGPRMTVQVQDHRGH